MTSWRLAWRAPPANDLNHNPEFGLPENGAESNWMVARGNDCASTHVVNAAVL